MTLRERIRRPSLAAIVALFFVAIGCAIGLGALKDNSFFTHLATGRVILHDWSVPTHDIYSFTARGEPWVVQSWIASVLFAGAERIGGAAAVRLLLTLTSAGLGLLCWRLSRPAGSLLPRVGAAALPLGVGFGLWVERPYLFALVLLGFTLLAAEGEIDPRWLLPSFWLWVNLHGSFPLGLVALALMALGRRLDGGRPTVELRALQWGVVGTLLGALNPLGPRLLVFPLELLQRSSALRFIIEWQAPRFTSAYERFFLLEVVVAIVALVRRPSYRSGLVMAVFIAAALLGSRNVSVASFVLLPGIAVGLEGLGTIPADLRPSIGFSGAVALLAGTAVIIAAGLGAEPYVTTVGYPVRGLAWLEAQGVDIRSHPTATEDFTGNYLEVLRGPDANTFFDDRVDMYPQSVVDDYVVLNRGGPGWREVLSRRKIQVVVWSRKTALGQLLTADPRWRLLYQDAKFLVACQRGVALRGQMITTC